MRIGVIGLGKIGLAWALVLKHHGSYAVVGYDMYKDRVKARLTDPQDHGERGMGDLIQRGSIDVLDSVADVLVASDIVYVCVQTPHTAGYDGTKPMPARPRDFEYAYLIKAIYDIASAAEDGSWRGTVIVMSTVLPGTCRGKLMPLLPEGVHLVYDPAFISLGTTVYDFLNPRWVILGDIKGDDIRSDVREVHETLDHHVTVNMMSFESAELTKVALNAWITTQITFANVLAQVAAKVNANVDDVTNALEIRHAGMSDGGACRPRDVIALQSIHQEFFNDLTRAREAHSRWLAHIVADEVFRSKLPVAVLGRTYKPGVYYVDGSPASLLVYYLDMIGVEPKWWCDPYVVGFEVPLPTDGPFVAVIATDHDIFRMLVLPHGSIVVDPWGTQPDRKNVRTIRPGRTLRQWT